MFKTEAWITKISFLSLCGLIFFLPASTAAVGIFSSLAILSWIILKFTSGIKQFSNDSGYSFWKGVKPASNFLNVPLGVFIGVVFITLFFSQFPALSWRAFFTKLLEGVLLFWVALESINSKKRVKVFLSVFVLSLFLVLGDATVQFFWGKDIFKGLGMIEDYRVRASFNHSNDFGAYIVLPAVSFLSLLVLIFTQNIGRNYNRDDVFYKRITPFALSVLTVLLLLALALSYSRGSWVGFFAGLLFFAWQNKRLWKWILAGILVLGIFFSVFAMFRHYRPGSEHWFSSISSLFNTSSRSEFWGEAINFWKESPLVGTGLNTYAVKVQKVYDSSMHQHSFYAHNCYLQILAETGFVGLISFLWVLWTLVHQTMIKLSKIPAYPYGNVILALLCGIFAFLVVCFFDTSLYSTQLAVYFWLMMGFMISILKIASKSEFLS